MSAPPFRLSHVTLPGSPGRPRLRGVTAEIPAGVTAVVGASGAGKSSLLEVCVGFTRPSGGVVARTAPPASGGESGGLFWAPADLGLWPGETVRDHLVAVQPERDDAAADDLLEGFFLTGVRDRRPGTLSTGERSRLAVARAAAARADLLVMDEPLAHVDPARLPRCWDRLREAMQACTAVLFATHDPAAAVRESTHCLAMADGEVTWSGPTAALYHAPPADAPAELLGPIVDLPADLRRRLGFASPAGDVRVRPERIEVEERPGGPLVVSASIASGPLTESAVAFAAPPADPFVVQHRTGPPLAAGARVAMRLAFAWLAAVVLGVAAGCGGAGEDGPALSFAAVRVRATPNAGPQLPAPRGVGIGPTGASGEPEAYVLDDAGRVLVFSAEGEERRRWNMPSNVNGNPEGICVYRPPGSERWLVAVADTHFHRVVLFTTEGEEVARFGVEGDEPGNFRFPVAVCADDAGRLYVGEYGGNDRVQVFSPHPEHAPLRSIGTFGTGPGQFSRPGGVVWVPPDAPASQGSGAQRAPGPGRARCWSPTPSAITFRCSRRPASTGGCWAGSGPSRCTAPTISPGRRTARCGRRSTTAAGSRRYGRTARCWGGGPATARPARWSRRGGWTWTPPAASGSRTRGIDGW